MEEGINFLNVIVIFKNSRMISIIIPTYNRAGVIKQTIDSIVSQTYRDWECIIVDDMSTDKTEIVIHDNFAHDFRVKYVKNVRAKGAQGARNTGIEQAKYDWLIFFDSDNIMHTNMLEIIVNNLKDSIDVCACCSRIVDVQSGPTGKIMDPNAYGNIHNGIFSGVSYVDFNQAAIRRSAIIDIGLLDENCPSMQEWDTHIRLSKTAHYFTIKKPLLDYYTGGDDAISSNNKREVNGRLYILSKHITEWRNQPSSLSRFLMTIIVLINRVKDAAFKKEKYQELKRLVPNLFWLLFVYILKYPCKIIKSYGNR